MNKLKIHFKIVTPERTVYENEVDQATLPVSDGEVTILPNHRSYIASLKSGEIILKVGKEEISMATAGGFLEFDKNNLIVLADKAERAEEIDLQRAEEARKKAEEIKKQKFVDEAEAARIAAAVEKEFARIKVAKKHRSKKGMKID
jgi:F-type H+-transporting ATPase subunit epsilon